jgi:hypothetical protein
MFSQTLHLVVVEVPVCDYYPYYPGLRTNMLLIVFYLLNMLKIDSALLLNPNKRVVTSTPAFTTNISSTTTEVNKAGEAISSTNEPLILASNLPAPNQPMLGIYRIV